MRCRLFLNSPNSFFLYRRKKKTETDQISSHSKKLVPPWYLVSQQLAISDCSYILCACVMQVRFAKPLDALLMTIGILMAIASGLALPGHMLMFGEVIDLFISYDISLTIRSQLNNSGINNSNIAQLFSMDLFGVNSSTYFCNLSETQQENSNIITLLTASNSGAELQYRIGLYSIYYVAMATAVLITSFLGTSLMNLSAYRQTKRMRSAFFRSVLKQDIGWFDVNPSAELNNRLSEYVFLKYTNSSVLDSLYIVYKENVFKSFDKFSLHMHTVI